MSTKLEKTLDGILSNFSEKQRKVLDGRFGLSGKKRTLQEIGDDIGVTRERIRQIESQAVQKIRPMVKSEFKELLQEAGEFLDKMGGVRRDDYFTSDLQRILSSDIIHHARYPHYTLGFLFLVGGAPHFYKEDDNVRSFWYSNEASKKKFLSFLKNLVSFFNKNNKDKILEEKIHLNKIKDFVAGNYISISKDFDVNVFGDFGLASWPEIRPAVIKDKAHLALKKHGQPVHFRDIAKLIDEFGMGFETHPQTVHNELIKDDRFVLVGRGMYALKGHGFEGGTVKEVIDRLLKKGGPLSSEEVVRLVSQKKILRENTILLNLQNRKYFKRLKDGRYHIREA